jgi:hypothetical protein
MKKEVQENKITPQKTVAKDAHTEEIKRYIKELNIASDKRIAKQIAEASATSDKKHQKLREEANDDIRKFMAINTEDFQSRVSAIAEQFLGLNEKLDATTILLSEKIDATNERLDATNERLDATNERLDATTILLSEKIDATNERLDATNEKLDATTKTLTEKLDSHTVMIGRLMIDVEEIKVGMREKVDRSDFNKLETRLVTLESIVFSGKANIEQKSKGS